MSTPGGGLFGWDPRAARAAWTVGLVALAFAAVFTIRKTLLIFVLALFLAYMIAPLVELIERHKWKKMPRGVSVFAAALIVAGVLAVAVALVAPSVADESQKLLEQLPKLDAAALVKKIPLPSSLESFRPRIEYFAAENLKATLPFAKRAGTEIFGLAGNIVFVVLIPILAILFVKDGAKMRKGILGELGPQSRERVAGILADLHKALGQYVRALGLLSLATLVSYGIFFTVAGVPYGLLLAVIAAILEVIPVVGPLAAALVALFVAGSAGYEHLWWIAGFIACYRILQDYVLSPYLMHGSIGVPPALVIFGLLAGDQIGGIAGIFLSIPILASLLILEKHLKSRAPAVR